MNDILYTLIEKAQNGDKDSMLKITNKFSPLTQKYSRLLGYDDANSELILALIETIYKIPINNKIFKNDKYAVSYIWHSIKNKYIFLSKRHNSISNFETELNLNIYTEPINYCFEDSIYLEELLDKLTPNEKKIITFRYLKDYSDAQIAKKLNISRQAVNKTKIKALNKLRNHVC